MRQRLAILGATGSIGTSTLDVVARHPGRFEVAVLSAHRQVDALVGLCRRFQPRLAIVSDPDGYRALRDGLADAGLSTVAAAGPDAIETAVSEPGVDTVVAAIVGAAGMGSTLAAARAGKRIVLANKESVVLAGALLMREIQRHGAIVVPVDSEHNAIFQCLPDGRTGRGGVRRLVLTASGGPFRGWSREQLAKVTPEQACKHPNWTMGRKISVDSASLMNKGLEVIEAHWLFGIDPALIDVVVHPQSIVHSMVDYVDGSTLAQLGHPDMRTALACGLAWPERIESGVAPLDLAAVGRLDFEPPDQASFPCLGLAYAALQAGGSAPATLSAANEVAVSAFLQGRAGFLDIPALLEATLDAVPATPVDTLEQVLAADAHARRTATALLPRYSAGSRS